MIPLSRVRGTKTAIRATAAVAAIASAAAVVAAGADDAPRDAVLTRPAAADRLPDPLRGTERIDPAVTGPDAEAVLAKLLPPRTDTAADWRAPLDPLHYCGEPRLLPPCVPRPPCHPSLPPRPYDLVGVAGEPTCGPIYRGPCAPRSADRHSGPLKHARMAHDRLFDWFYRTK